MKICRIICILAQLHLSHKKSLPGDNPKERNKVQGIRTNNPKEWMTIRMWETMMMIRMMTILCCRLWWTQVSLQVSHRIACLIVFDGYLIILSDFTHWKMKSILLRYWFVNRKQQNVLINDEWEGDDILDNIGLIYLKCKAGAVEKGIEINLAETSKRKSLRPLINWRKISKCLKSCMRH